MQSSETGVNMQLDLFSSSEIKENHFRFIIENGGQINNVIYSKEKHNMSFMYEESDEESAIRYIARNHGVSETEARKAIQKAKNNPESWIVYQELSYEDYIF